MMAIIPHLNIFSCVACDRGFYGDCRQMCSNCLNADCNKTDGHCAEGCEAGYWGELCNNGNVKISSIPDTLNFDPNCF